MWAKWKINNMDKIYANNDFVDIIQDIFDKTANLQDYLHGMIQYDTYGRIKKVLLIGAGGWSREHWIDIVLPDFQDKIEIVGLVDLKSEILKDSGKKLNLPSHLLLLTQSMPSKILRLTFALLLYLQVPIKKFTN